MLFSAPAVRWRERSEMPLGCVLAIVIFVFAATFICYFALVTGSRDDDRMGRG